MRLFFICFPLFISAWWSIFFTECDEKEDKTAFKKNKELYISNIRSKVYVVFKLLKNYENTVAELLNGTNNDIFKKEIDVEIEKLNTIFTNIGFNIGFDFIEPLYDEKKNKFTHISMEYPTDSYANINTAAMQEQVLITNKITIYLLMLSYILQLKNNMLSYFKEEMKDEFNKNFYKNVLKPLLIEIDPIISNVYENGKEDKNKNGEEKSFFDLLPIAFNFIDKNTFVIDFYKQHVKNENINEEIINTNKKINDGTNNNEEIKGLLWRIGKNQNTYF